MMTQRKRRKKRERDNYREKESQIMTKSE